MTKIALITGASSGTSYHPNVPIAYSRRRHLGIGRVTATALSKAGWDIVITARRLDRLEETKTQCEETSKILVLAGDISDEQFVVELFKQTVSTFGNAAM